MGERRFAEQGEDLQERARWGSSTSEEEVGTDDDSRADGLRADDGLTADDGLRGDDDLTADDDSRADEGLRADDAEQVDGAPQVGGIDEVDAAGEMDNEGSTSAQGSASTPVLPTTEPTTPAPAPAPMPQPVGSGFGARDTGRFVSADASEKLQERWRGIQFDFVDDPHHAVEEADALLQQLATQVTESIDAGCQSLRGSWQKDGPGSAALDDGTPTEQLRTTLREYRDLVNRLLAI